MSITFVAIYALMFLGAVLLLEGLSQLVFAIRDPQQKAVNRRLRLLESGHDPDEIYRLLRRRASQEGWMAWTVVFRFNAYLQQAGVTASMGMVLTLLTALTLIATVIGVGALRLAPLFAGALAFVVVVGATTLVLGARRRKRLTTLENQLPELLDLIVRSVRSGHPLSTALRLAAKEMPEPLGSEVGIAVDETTYGIPLVDAIESMATRIGLNDYAYFAIVAKITSKTGGNIATILENLSHIIRERIKLRRKIKAISAEGRISGLVMSMAPIGIGGFVFLTSPSFFLDVAEDPLFDRLIMLIGFLTIANYLALRRIVNFEF